VTLCASVPGVLVCQCASVPVCLIIILFFFAVVVDPTTI